MLNKTTELLNERIGAVASQPIHRDLREDMTQLGITYRGSSLVLQEGGEISTIHDIGYNKESVTAALAGDRAPDTPNLIDVGDSGNAVNIYSILSPSRHSVFVFSDGHSDEDQDTISRLIHRQPESTVQGFFIHRTQASGYNGKFHKVLIDGEGHAHATYKITKPCIIIIRPDGVIGARVSRPSNVEQYFKGIFTNI